VQVFLRWASEGWPSEQGWRTPWMELEKKN
jgi:hypothetical protein